MSTLSEQAELLHSIVSPVEDVLRRLHVLVPTCADIAEIAAALGAGVRSTSELHAKVEEVTPRLDRVRADFDGALRLVEAMQHGEGYAPGASPAPIGTRGGPGELEANLDVVLEQLGVARVSIADANRRVSLAYAQAEQVLQGAVEYAGGQLAELAQLLVDTVERIASDLRTVDGPWGMPQHSPSPRRASAITVMGHIFRRRTCPLRKWGRRIRRMPSGSAS